MTSEPSSIRRPIVLALAILVAVGAAVILLRSRSDAPERADHGVVEVVPGATIALQPAPGSSAPATAPKSPQQVADMLTRAFPLLRDVTIRCDGAACAITADATVPTEDGELRAFEEMVRSEIRQRLGEQGLHMANPVQMDEQGSQEVRLHIRTAG